MDDIQEQLDSQVSSVLQSALNQFERADIDGLLSNESEMAKFKEILYQDVDLTIAEMSDRSFRRMKDLVDIYNDDLDRKKTYEANKNTINPDLSTINGFYYNMN